VEDFAKGRCVAVSCGGRNQRPCLVVERIPSCDQGLREDFGTNRCVPLKPGETPFTAGLSSLTGEIAKGTQVCEETLSVFPEFKSGAKAAAVGLSCQHNMNVGFVCAAPSAAQKISDTVELGHKVAREFDSSPCKDELKWYRAKATLHGSSKGLKCAKGQFFDLTGKGTCWSCPRGYSRNLEPVTSRHACTRVSGTPSMFRAQCAVVMAVVRDADKAFNCLGAMIRTGLLPEAFRGKQKDMCLMAGGEAFFATLDYLTGTPNPKTTIQRIVKRIRKVNSAFNKASKANDFLEKVNGLRECKGVIDAGTPQTASYRPTPAPPPAAGTPPAPIGSSGPLEGIVVGTGSPSVPPPRPIPAQTGGIVFGEAAPPAPLESKPPARVSALPPQDRPSTTQRFRAGQALSVHEGPSPTAPAMAILEPGTEVEVTGRTGDWVRVALRDGRTGYALGGLLERSGHGPGAGDDPQDRESGAAAAQPVRSEQRVDPGLAPPMPCIGGHVNACCDDPQMTYHARCQEWRPKYERWRQAYDAYHRG
jgi:hypothetical protein